MSVTPLFSPDFLKQRLQNFYLEDVADLENKKAIIQQWIVGLKTGALKKKETSLDADFMNTFFGDVLGYEHQISIGNWNLEKKYSIAGSKEADGVLGYFKSPNEDIFDTEKSKKDLFVNADVRVVIELKTLGTDLDKKQNRADRQTPVEQAFGYANKLGENCKWLIVSNYREIRLYNKSVGEEKCETFFITQLTEEEQLKRFFYLLNFNSLFLRNQPSAVEIALQERQQHLQNITQKFYSEYKKIRVDLFEHLRNKNPQHEKNPLLLLEKAQKILDRILFVCFCEWLAITPSNLLQQVIKNAEDGFGEREGKLWRGLKEFFESMDKGLPPHINKFNGGLFKEDEELDNLFVTNWALEQVLELRKYDYSNDLTVNILGHIFEQSISDLEEISSKFTSQIQLTGDKSTDTKTLAAKDKQRKKDGIFYTPEYITSYIVNEAIGGWLEDRKKEFGFYELPYLSDEERDSLKRTKQNTISSIAKSSKKIIEKVKKHTAFWLTYREALQNIKVIDIACGSGAFLVKVFDVLKMEFEKVNKELAELKPGQQKEIFDLDKFILNNNIFGVDLNSSSVEITQLSLWLKTANRSKELTTLDENIMCGNSLIDDEKIAGNRAFKWDERFKEIMSNGGFDIVIGNPPWGAEIKSNHHSFIKKYFGIKKTLDSSEYFILKGLQLLKKDTGMLSLIVPKSIIFYNNWDVSRQKLLNKKIISLADVGLAFEEVNLESCVFCLKNISAASNQIFINKFEPLKKIVAAKTVTSLPSIEQKLMQKSSAIILTEITPEISHIIQKIQHTKEFLSNIKREVFRGIYIPDAEKEKILDRGSDLFVNKVPDVSMYHINLIRNINLENFKKTNKEKIKKVSRDRIIIKVLRGKRLTATFANKKIISTEKLVNLVIKDAKTNPLYVLSLLNSKLISFYLSKVVFSDVTETSRVMDDCYLKQIPIKKISPKAQQSFIDKANTMLSKKQELHKIKEGFIKTLCADAGIEKPNKKLQNWYELSELELFSEIKKFKITLQKSELNEWREYFLKIKIQANEIQETIKTTENEIDKMVYELYDLTEDERKIVEQK